MRSQKGFTLIELLVVIGIIGLLATVAVVSLTGPRRTARDTKRVADVTNIRTALELYNSEVGGYPMQDVDLGTTNSVRLTKEAGFGNSTSGTTIYMDNIPSSPSPVPTSGTYHYKSFNADGTTPCTTGTSCASYKITFALEGSVQNLQAGPRTATPSGIQ